jgi:hypothetical protein
MKSQLMKEQTTIDVRGTTSAPAEMSGSTPKAPILNRNDKVNSASPVAKKQNQRKNGKALPPLKRNAHK